MKKFQFILIIFVFVFIAASPTAAQEGPSLPEGLGDNSSPVLPEGLGGSEMNAPSLPEGLGGSQTPALPSGMGDSGGPSLPGGLEEEKREAAGDKPPLTPNPEPRTPRSYSLSGFWEIRGGIRIQSDPYQKDASLGETRLQAEFETRWQEAAFKIRPDFLLDPVMDDYKINLEEGRGIVDLREANVSFSPLAFMDMKFGRQILTWGTGDMLFITDMFPKDWQSFFIGRDDEYLKAPSDALKASLFSDAVNLDIVYTPRFDSDRFPCGKRLSYYNRMLGRRAGEDAVIETDKPDEWFKDDEWAARIYKTVQSIELAAYGYQGFWKGPSGMDSLTGKAAFTKLNVYGASIRGQIASGIANLEFGYYDSRDDEEGDDPFTDNSQFRILAGYERDLPEIAKDFKVGIQYYVEHIMDYEAYEQYLPQGAKAADEDRHVITLRLTQQLMNQNLTLSLFTYYSPTDADAYLRPNVRYKIDDRWTAVVGGNVFTGADGHTFFGQFGRNTNVYAGLHYGF